MAAPQRKNRRRLIVCMDGTWNDGINSDNPLTNVARFARCVGAGNYEDEDGVQIIQITFYLTGIGTGTSFRANVKDAIFGRGEFSAEHLPLQLRTRGTEMQTHSTHNLDRYS